MDDGQSYAHGQMRENAPAELVLFEGKPPIYPDENQPEHGSNCWTRDPAGQTALRECSTAGSRLSTGHSDASF
jgi:hypothetical protein